MSNNNDLIQDILSESYKKIQEFEKTKVLCGFIGPSGSGKSSLMNAIVGEKIAETGVVETTSEPKAHTHKGIVFTDLPGCGTTSWPRDNYIQRLNLQSYDCFLLVTAHRFTENDVFLFRELLSMGKPCFVIRNMFDEAIKAGKRDNGQSEEETRLLITDNIRKNLEPSIPNKIYLVSAWHPAKYDLWILEHDIHNALKGLKKDRFIADMASYSEDALKEKRILAEKLIPYYAGAAAANGLNPIIGLDVAADIAILIKFATAIANIYGLSSNQLEYIKKLLGPKLTPVLLAKITQFAVRYMAKEGIIVLLKKIAGRTITKEVAKWVPFAGQLIAAGISWQATFMLGGQLVDEAEQLARDILKEVTLQQEYFDESATV